MDAFPLSERQYVFLRDCVYAHTGIFLPPAKKDLLAARIQRRLRLLQLDVGRYCQLLSPHLGTPELPHLIDAITTRETSFFREPAQFHHLIESILPHWRTRRKGQTLRAWSAGCSSGEEPYSLAMVLLSEWVEKNAGDIDVVATDVSPSALEHAREATWSKDKETSIPAHFRRFLLRGVGPEAGRIRVAPEVRTRVRFLEGNLRKNAGVTGRFDLIFCRNVLIYFDAGACHTAHALLADHLLLGGYLFLGHAESLLGKNSALRPVMPSVYRKEKPERGTT